MKRVFLLISSSLILSSCAGNFQSNLDSFSVLNNQDSKEFRKKGGKFFSELNLTQEQKTLIAIWAQCLKITSLSRGNLPCCVLNVPSSQQSSP